MLINIFSKYLTGISVVTCFETVVNHCLEKIFELPTIDDLFEKISNLIEKNSDNIPVNIHMLIFYIIFGNALLKTHLKKKKKKYTGK